MDFGSPRHADTSQGPGTPRQRDTFVAKTFKRRSTNVESLQKSIQLLDDAVSPTMNTFSRTPRPGNLRNSTYTPARVGTPTRFDTSELFAFTSAKKKTLADDTVLGGHDGSPLAGFRMQSNETIYPSFHTTMMDDVTVTDRTFLAYEGDHGQKVSLELLESFKDSLKSCSGTPQVLDLVSKYGSICESYVSKLTKLGMRVTKNQTKMQKTMGLLDLLQDEQHTWQLVYSLYKDRLEEEAKADGDEMPMEVQMAKPQVWALSEQNIANRLFEKDSTVRQSQLVVDWLEQCSCETSDMMDNALYFNDEPVAWENTLHHLQKVKQRLPSAHDKAIVSEMDPDAPHRQQRSLDNVDETDERRLLRSLFSLLRCGQLDKASELCQRYGQAWRAASLEGWRLLHDPNYQDTTSDPDGRLRVVEGNFYRDVWKAVCWRMASEPDLDQWERALYASLSGNLLALLPVCFSWRDYVWAYFRVMVDVRVEQEVRLHKKTNRQLEDLPTEFYDKLMEPQEIFMEIEASVDENVSLEAKTWYPILQKYLILDDVSGLIEHMYSWLQRERELLPTHLVRLMAHLVLFLRSIGHSTKEELCEIIMEAFVEDLIKDRSSKNLVAFYVATLSTGAQVMWYSRFLEGITDQDERRQCLAWAEEEGLDVAAITKTVVETIRTRDTTSNLPADSLVPDLTISEEDAAKIHAIDWLVFDENHRPEAIRQANSLLRCFITVKKYAAARQVFNKLPADTVDVIYRLWHLKTDSADLPSGDSNAIREYLCMKVYLDAVESFNDWFVLYHQGQPVKPSGEEGGSFTDRVAMEHRMKQYKMDHDRWMHNLQVQTKTSRDRIYNVLLFPDGGWLVDAAEDPEVDELRQHQMAQLRYIHLPALCLNLHTILHSSGLYEDAVQIADVVASEVHQLYQVFDKESLQHLLAQISRSSHSLLNASKDPLGYQIV